NNKRKEINQNKKRLWLNNDKKNIKKELFEAIKSNDVEKVKQIIEEERINTNEIYDEDKFTPLHIAVVYNQLEIIKKLLKSGANPNAEDSEGNTPLHFTAEQNNLETLRLLIEHGGNVNAVNEYN